jgi:flavin-dependent dehydrogenase
MQPSHHSVLIVGGGTAGITVAAQLVKKIPATRLAIIEPSDKHYYQPLWTLVGGGFLKNSAASATKVILLPRASLGYVMLYFLSSPTQTACIREMAINLPTTGLSSPPAYK